MHSGAQSTFLGVSKTSLHTYNTIWGHFEVVWKNHEKSHFWAIFLCKPHKDTEYGNLGYFWLRFRNSILRGGRMGWWNIKTLLGMSPREPDWLRVRVWNVRNTLNDVSENPTFLWFSLFFGISQNRWTFKNPDFWSFFQLWPKRKNFWCTIWVENTSYHL